MPCSVLGSHSFTLTDYLFIYYTIKTTLLFHSVDTNSICSSIPEKAKECFQVDFLFFFFQDLSLSMVFSCCVIFLTICCAVQHCLFRLSSKCMDTTNELHKGEAMMNIYISDTLKSYSQRFSSTELALKPLIDKIEWNDCFIRQTVRWKMIKFTTSK